VRTIEDVAKEPQQGDVVTLRGGKVRWTVRSFMLIPQPNGPMMPLVIASRKQSEPEALNERIAINVLTWGDLVRTGAESVATDLAILNEG